MLIEFFSNDNKQDRREIMRETADMKGVPQVELLRKLREEQAGQERQ
jgi:hypothetical protein